MCSAGVDRKVHGLHFPFARTAVFSFVVLRDVQPVVAVAAEERVHSGALLEMIKQLHFGLVGSQADDALLGLCS